MQVFTRVSLVAATAMMAAGLGTAPAQAIVGGVLAKQGEFPWQVSLERKSVGGSFSHSCGV